MAVDDIVLQKSLFIPPPCSSNLLSYVIISSTASQFIHRATVGQISSCSILGHHARTTEKTWSVRCWTVIFIWPIYINSTQSPRVATSSRKKSEPAILTLLACLLACLLVIQAYLWACMTFFQYRIEIENLSCGQEESYIIRQIMIA